MAFFNPSNETFSNQRFSAIIYGAPGVGKTTLAFSAPNPVLVDLDKGVQRIRAQHRKAYIRVQKYQELLEDLDSEEMRQFDTVILDTGGALISLMQRYVMEMDVANKTKSGTISQKGYGAIKAEFQRLTNWFKTTLDKNIIYVFHSVEEKNKDGVAMQRLLCEGSAKNIVWQPCDFGGYVFMNGDQRVIGLTPTDEYFAKGCYGIQGVRKVPTLGAMDQNDFLTKLFAEANENIAADNEFFQEERRQYEEVMEQGKDMINQCTTASDFTNVAKALGELPHKLTSLVELRSIYKERVKALGLVWDKDKKVYVFPELEQPKKTGKQLADSILEELGVKSEETGDTAKNDTMDEREPLTEGKGEKTPKETVFGEVNE